MHASIDNSTGTLYKDSQQPNFCFENKGQG